MCGINLIIDKHKKLDINQIDKMSLLTRHRGPDESTVKIIEGKSKNYHLSVNRLKITDHSDFASQPFFDINSNCALLFNGEIYNFYELKNKLLREKITFSTSSDTEVLFYWIRKYGNDGIKQLEGMFSFIFIDFSSERVLIARDQFGIKPMYFYQNDGYFIASSEIQSIVGTGLVKKELNRTQVLHYLLYKYADAPETFFQNVYELEHGHYLDIRGNTLKKGKYWNQKATTLPGTPDINRIEELILESLLQQLHANVPLGLLLSGGVDSTLLLAMAHKEGFKLPTYSIVNSKNERSFGTNDYYFSRIASEIYSSDHHELVVDVSLFDRFEEFIATMDQPIGDSSYLMTAEICREASKSMKILLSGAGADELFAGYNRHWAFYKYLINKQALNVVAPLLNPFLNNLPTGIQHPLRKKFRLLKKWSRSYDPSPQSTYNKYLTFDALNSHLSVLDENEDEKNWIGWALEHDQSNFLISDVLALSDKASMLHGIELRVPYLNEKLRTYLNSHQPDERIKYGQKWMLKNVLKKYGGKKFVNRPKEGFGLPLSNWLFDPRVVHLWNPVNSKNHVIYEFFDKNIVKKLVNQQKQKVEDHSQLLWSILVLSHWINRNF